MAVELGGRINGDFGGLEEKIKSSLFSQDENSPCSVYSSRFPCLDVGNGGKWKESRNCERKAKTPDMRIEG